MADKKLNEVTKVTDMEYVPVIMADGSIGQISKADLASVVAGVMENTGWVNLLPNKVYRFCLLGSSNSKFLEYVIAVPNWQGASFFKFYIAASYMSDGSDIKTATEGVLNAKLK